MATDRFACVGAVVLFLPSVVVVTLLDPATQRGLLSRAAIGLAAFVATSWLVPTLAVYTERKGLFGKDLGKRFIPERAEVKVGPRRVRGGVS